MMQWTKNREGMDDIVFATRNQLYGAYLLRKSYSNHMIRALFTTMLLLITAYALGTWFWKASLPKPITDEVLTPFQPMTDYVVEIELKPQPQIPEVSLQKRRVNDQYLIAPDHTPLPIEIPNTNPGPAVTGKGQSATSPIGGDVPVPGIPAPLPTATELRVADEMPEFPGGETALYDYLKTNIHIPREAEIAEITGKVLVSFVVETDGSITNVTIEKSRGFGLDEEAARVIAEMPKWKPGRQQNEKVRVRFFLPIRFDF